MWRERVSRRGFLSGAAAVGAFAIVPRRVLGGPGKVPPSDRINNAIIGVGGTPGGACTHWKAPPYHGAHPNRSFATNGSDRP